MKWRTIMSLNSLETTVDSIGQDLGNRFGAALAAKNAAALRAMFADRVDFRAMTPNRTWDGATPAGVIDDVVLGTWFSSSHSMELVEATTTGVVGQRHGFVYRLQGTNGDGGFVIEQHAYAEVAEGKITWMRVLCSGFQPLRVIA
jgi:hypothetical protein